MPLSACGQYAHGEKPHGRERQKLVAAASESTFETALRSACERIAHLEVQGRAPNGALGRDLAHQPEGGRLRDAEGGARFVEGPRRGSL